MDMGFFAGLSAGARWQANYFGGSRGDFNGNVTPTAYYPGGTAYLTAMMMDKMGEYNAAPDNDFPIIYHPDGDPGQPLVTHTQGTYRSPTLWRYNRDHTTRSIQNNTTLPQPIVDILTFESEDWQTQFLNNAGASGTGAHPVGTPVDGVYMNSQNQSAFQEALSRAKVAVFFGGMEPIQWQARNRNLLYTGAGVQEMRETAVDPFAAGG